MFILKNYQLALRSLQPLSGCLTLASVPPNFFLSEKFGGGEQDRTADPLLAKQVLSQLSYAPLKWWAQVDSNH